MADITFRNCEPHTPINRAARYRITWRMVGAAYFPDSGLPTADIARKLQEALPQLGFMPLTLPAVVPGDAFVIYRVQLTSTFQGHTCADIAAQADRLPILSGTVSLRAALDVMEVELVPPMTQNALYLDDAAARKRAQEAVAKKDIVNTVTAPIKDLTKNLGEGLSDLAKFAIGAVVVGAVAYLIFVTD